MQIQINAADMEASDSLWKFIEEEVRHELRHHAEQLTGVEVHLHDLNSPQKAGIDKRVLMEARLRGHQPIVAQDESSDIYEAVKGAAGKLNRALSNHLGRISSRRTRDRSAEPFEGG